MGINLSVYRIKGVIEETDIYPDCLYRLFDKERHPTWDLCRHSGDRDFWRTEDLEWDTRCEGDFEPERSFNETYHRPKDIDKAIEWVKKNIYLGNQKRLIDILEEMRGDSSLYFTCSY